MPSPHIRPIAGCIFLHNGKILVSEGHDEATGEHFYRVIGGGLEFGETSEQALHREIKEELGVDIFNIRLLSVTENIFTYNNAPGHELFFCYDGEFVDRSWYDREDIVCDKGLPSEARARWVSVEQVVSGDVTVYPAGMKQILRNVGSSNTVHMIEQ